MTGSPGSGGSGQTGGSTSTSASAGGGGTNAGGAAGQTSASVGAGGFGGGLQLESATMISGTDVKLVFSEARLPTTAVDPKDFRIGGTTESQPGAQYACYGQYSCAYPLSTGQCYHATCGPSSNLSSFYCCPPITQGATRYYDVGRFIELAPGGAANELIASLERGILETACTGLYLHYAQSAAPVESVSHDTLGTIGSKTWVTKPKRRRLHVKKLLPAAPRPVDITILATLCHGQGCSDGLLDNYEGDVDCGGVCSTKCANGQTCQNGLDCISGTCTQHLCVGP
jgi:hypothetical protein